MANLTLVRVKTTSLAGRALLVVGIIGVAFNLRASITAVGPLLASIRVDLHISNGLAGSITTFPLLAFGLMSPLAPRIGNRLGLTRSIFVGLILLISGIAVRSFGSTITLLVGTICLGLGIAVCNVLLPSLVKQQFPERVGIMTSTYSTAMGLIAAIASGVSIPLSVGMNLGWQKSLAVWAVLAVLTAVIWLPQLRTREPRGEVFGGGAVPAQLTQTSVWRSSLAWQVTFFMGLQSFLYFCIVAWLPAILNDKGLSPSTAGWLLFLVQFVGLPATFLTPILADKLANQRGIVVGIGVLYLLGVLTFMLGRDMGLMVLASILVGLSQGSSIGLALTLLGLRTNDARHAANLSGMAQSVGYLLAAAGPVLIGVLFDFSHSFTLPFILMIVAAVLMVMAGLGAGKNQTV